MEPGTSPSTSTVSVSVAVVLERMSPSTPEATADTVRDGGYPALLLDPIDFLQLYRRQVLSAQQQQQQGGAAPQTA